MLSDGGSVAFTHVRDLLLYPVQKLESLNHAHKQMGTALRSLQKEEHLGGRGTGRLTAAKCDNLQNYYQGALKGRKFVNHQNLLETNKLTCSILTFLSCFVFLFSKYRVWCGSHPIGDLGNFLSCDIDR